MRTYKANEAVKGGYYLNLHGWKMEAIEGTAGVLDGDAEGRYVRVPLLALLVVAPLLGLLFVVVLPFLGIAVLAEQGYHKVREVVAARHTTTVKPTTVRRQ